MSDPINDFGAKQYPFLIPIKIIGPSTPDFQYRSISIVKRLAPDVDDHEVTSTLSKGGKYTSVTCSFTAKSRPHLEAVYASLTESPYISMVL